MSDAARLRAEAQAERDAAAARARVAAEAAREQGKSEMEAKLRGKAAELGTRFDAAAYDASATAHELGTKTANVTSNTAQRMQDAARSPGQTRTTTTEPLKERAGKTSRSALDGILGHDPTVHGRAYPGSAWQRGGGDVDQTPHDVDYMTEEMAAKSGQTLEEAASKHAHSEPPLLQRAADMTRETFDRARHTLFGGEADATDDAYAKAQARAEGVGPYVENLAEQAASKTKELNSGTQQQTLSSESSRSVPSTQTTTQQPEHEHGEHGHSDESLVQRAAEKTKQVAGRARRAFWGDADEPEESNTATGTSTYPASASATPHHERTYELQSPTQPRIFPTESIDATEQKAKMKLEHGKHVVQSKARETAEEVQSKARETAEEAETLAERAADSTKSMAARAWHALWGEPEHEPEAVTQQAADKAKAVARETQASAESVTQRAADKLRQVGEVEQQAPPATVVEDAAYVPPGFREGGDWDDWAVEQRTLGDLEKATDVSMTRVTKSLARDVSEETGNVVESAADTARTTARRAGEQTRSAAQQAVNKTRNATERAADKTKSAAQEAVDKARNAAAQVVDTTRDVTRSTAEQVADKTRSAAEQVADKTRTAADRAADTTRSAAQQAADTTRAAAKRAKEVVVGEGPLFTDQREAGEFDDYAENLEAASMRAMHDAKAKIAEYTAHRPSSVTEATQQSEGLLSATGEYITAASQDAAASEAPLFTDQQEAGEFDDYAENLEAASMRAMHDAKSKIAQSTARRPRSVTEATQQSEGLLSATGEYIAAATHAAFGTAHRETGEWAHDAAEEARRSKEEQRLAAEAETAANRVPSTRTGAA